MAFSLSFESPTAAQFERVWERAQYPPSSIHVVFTPATPTTALHGRPAKLFLDPDPPAGDKLIAQLETPSAPGQANEFTLDVNVEGEPTIHVQCTLRWQT